jgi:N-formylglutamate amidohydrolase
MIEPTKLFETNFIGAHEGKNPILLEMPHSGLNGYNLINDIPHYITRKLRRSKAVQNTIGSGCDSAVPQMSGFITLKNYREVSTLHNTLARVFCDTNRSREEVSDWALEDGIPLEHHHGVIWARTVFSDEKLDLSLQQEWLEAIVRANCEKMFSEPLTGDEFEKLMTEHYDVYHANIRYFHRVLKEKYGVCVHLALHSLPPFLVEKVWGGYIFGQKATRGPMNKENRTMPDIILIHNNYQAADKRYVDAVRSAFEEAGLIVEDGKGPFRGDIGVTNIYGDPYNGIHVIGIEHVTHDTEPFRHLGNPSVNAEAAWKYPPAYSKAVSNVLKATK